MYLSPDGSSTLLTLITSDQISLDQSRTPITFSILESLWVKLEALVCDDIFGFHSDTPPHQHIKICSKNKLSKKNPKHFHELDLKINLIAI